MKVGEQVKYDNSSWEIVRVNDGYAVLSFLSGPCWKENILVSIDKLKKAS